MRKWKFLWKILRKYKGALCNILIIVLTCSIIMLLYPYITGIMIDQVFYAGNMQFLYKTIFFLTVLYVGNELLMFINYLTHHYLSQKALLDIKTLLYKQVFVMKASRLSRLSTGEIGTIINEDSNKVLDLLIDTVFYLLADISRLLFIFGILLFISPIIAVSLFVIATLITICMRLLGKKIASQQTQLRNQYGRFISVIVGLVIGIDTIKLMPNEQYLNGIIKDNCVNLTELKKKSVGVELIRNRVVQFLTLLGTLSLYFLSARLIETGRLTVGLFIAVMEYFLIAIKYINNLSGKYALIKKDMISIKRVIALFEEETDEDETGDELVPSTGTIMFNDVTFGYDGVQIYRHLNMEIHGGITTAIVGKSGSGKSTIIEMIARIFNPQQGTITYASKEINGFELAAWRKHVGIMLQETVIFDDMSLRDNILLGAEEQGVVSLLHICEEVGLGALLKKLPDALDTSIKAGALSGGERQKIAFARMLVHNPPMIIMDESTSALDVHAERQVINMLIEKLRGKTLIIVSHRPYTVVNADEIILIENGAVIDRGTNNELQERCPLYNRLFKEEKHGE